MSEKIKILDKNIKELKPSEKIADYWDTEISGFYVRVSISGSITFKYYYRFNGKGSNYTIGRFGPITCTQAREIVKSLAVKVAMGINPQAEKNQSKITTNTEITSITLKQFVEGPYYEWRKANRKNPEETIKRIKFCFFEDFENTKLKDFTILLVEIWKTKRLNAGVKAETVNRDIADLRGLLSKAVEWEILEDHPLKRLKQSKVDRTLIIRYLEEREQSSLRLALSQRDDKIKHERITANIWRSARGRELFPEISQHHYSDHMHPMILLSLNTGVRQGELFSLWWDDINFNTKILTVRGAEAKSSQTRFIPLNTEAIDVLTKWQKQNNNIANGLIFSSSVTGNEFDNVRKAWATIKKIANITKFRWHDLRHDFASQLVMGGVDLNTVRELLGHADIRTTMRYAHLAPHHKARAVEVLCAKKITPLQPKLEIAAG